MKKTLHFAAAALLALLTPSCLEHSATIRLNKDGSGTITEETVFSAEATAMMSQMGEGAEDPAAKLSDAKKAAANAAEMGEGVSVEKVEKIDKDGRKGGRVTYKFKDINQVKFTFGDAVSDSGKDMGPPGAPGDAPDGEDGKPEKKPISFSYKDGTLTLVNPELNPDSKKDAKKPAAGEEGDAPDEAPEPDAQAMAMMGKMFKDMRMALVIELPGGIDETNASHVEGDSITLMDMAFGKLIGDPANMKKLSSMQNSSPAEMAAAFKDIEELKIETKEKITVKLK